MRKLKRFLFLFLIFLTGCGPQSHEPISVSEFKLNTIVSVTVYDSRDTSLLDGCMDICDKYELLFSRTDPESELYRLNHRELPLKEGYYELHADTAALIEKGLQYCEISDGAFDITVAPLSDLWNFSSESPSVPAPGDLRSALADVDYTAVTLQDSRIRLGRPGTALDLGAVAKGYIADRIKDYLESQGVKSAMINLGGNVLCIGSKPDGSPFKIGIQKPFAGHSETIATMDIRDKSVVSSGIYERCFEEDGKLYHHLLDPETGFPYENHLISVTIVSDASVDGDGLSTACFALGLEKGQALIESLPGVDAVFITDDYELHYTGQFKSLYLPSA